MNPIYHSNSSMEKFHGVTEDDFAQFLMIHEKMDVSKMYFTDSRHRALTHTMFWVNEVIIPIFGSYITLSNGDKISIKDICEHHILEDYGMKFIPTPQDFLQHIQTQKWMNNGEEDLRPKQPTTPTDIVFPDNFDWKDLITKISEKTTRRTRPQILD